MINKPKSDNQHIYDVISVLKVDSLHQRKYLQIKVSFYFEGTQTPSTSNTIYSLIDVGAQKGVIAKI
jgi:hypothetical protein